MSASSHRRGVLAQEPVQGSVTAAYGRAKCSVAVPHRSAALACGLGCLGRGSGPEVRVRSGSMHLFARVYKSGFGFGSGLERG
eukprot:497932-Prorocentrum_minimum.AAC.1